MKFHYEVLVPNFMNFYVFFCQCLMGLISLIRSKSYVTLVLWVLISLCWKINIDWA